MKIGESTGRDPAGVGGVGKNSANETVSTDKETTATPPNLAKIAEQRGRALSGRIAQLSAPPKSTAADMDPAARRLVLLTVVAAAGNEEARNDLNKAMDGAGMAGRGGRAGAQQQKLAGWFNVAMALVGRKAMDHPGTGGKTPVGIARDHEGTGGIEPGKIGLDPQPRPYPDPDKMVGGGANEVASLPIPLPRPADSFGDMPIPLLREALEPVVDLLKAGKTGEAIAHWKGLSPDDVKKQPDAAIQHLLRESFVKPNAAMSELAGKLGDVVSLEPGPIGEGALDGKSKPLTSMFEVARSLRDNMPPAV